MQVIPLALGYLDVATCQALGGTPTAAVVGSTLAITLPGFSSQYHGWSGQWTIGDPNASGYNAAQLTGITFVGGGVLAATSGTAAAAVTAAALDSGIGYAAFTLNSNPDPSTGIVAGTGWEVSTDNGATWNVSGLVGGPGTGLVAADQVFGDSGTTGDLYRLNGPTAVAFADGLTVAAGIGTIA